MWFWSTHKASDLFGLHSYHSLCSRSGRDARPETHQEKSLLLQVDAIFTQGTASHVLETPFWSSCCACYPNITAAPYGPLRSGCRACDERIFLAFLPFWKKTFTCRPILMTMIFLLRQKLLGKLWWTKSTGCEKLSFQASPSVLLGRMKQPKPASRSNTSKHI